MTDLPLTITEAAAALRGGEITSVELTQRVFKQADRLDDALGVYLCRMDETVLEEAAKADKELAAGIDKGPLQGIPLGVKDIIATDGAPTTANSRVLDPAWGQRDDATVVKKLRAAGAIMLGKTGLWEFATGWPDPETGFPIARNPWDTAR